MEKKTEHLGLTLPSPEEFYDVNIFDANFETLDTAIAKEKTAREKAVADEAEAREAAVAEEKAAREQAISAEAAARAQGLDSKAQLHHTHGTGDVNGLDAVLARCLQYNANSLKDFNFHAGGFYTDIFFEPAEDQSPYHTPLGESGVKEAAWYTVFTLGNSSTRLTQIALMPYSHERKTYIRYEHDGEWSKWQKVATKDDLETETTKQMQAIAAETAARAQALAGKIDKSRTLTDGIDLNTVIESGMYRCQTFGANAPDGVAYGQLLVLQAGGDTIAQVYFPYTESVAYVRTSQGIHVAANPPWHPWKKFALADDLKNYLPLTGGTLTGPIAVKRDVIPLIELDAYGEKKTTIFKNASSTVDGGTVIQDFSASGASAVLNISGQNQTAYVSNNSGNHEIVHTGNLSSMLARCGTPNNTWIPVGDDCYVGDHNVGGCFCIKATSPSAPGIRLFNAEETVAYEVLHTGNKPSGSYTGNGSSAHREINTGGTGNICLIYSSDIVALVTPTGIIYEDRGSPGGYTSSYGRFSSNGVLGIDTASEVLNKNGTTYYYQVL